MAKKDMTFILGAKCIDGAVMVGDTKVTIGEGTDYTYAQKLMRPFPISVLGASGATGLFNSFQSRMQVAFAEQAKQGKKFDTHEEIKTLVENVIREMHRAYKEDRYFLVNNLNVLMGIRINPIPELVNFTGLGLPEPVNGIKVIGHGEPYGALFIKKMWNPKMTMEQTAKLALFVIKLICETEIDASVGYRSTDFLPQVFYLPNVLVDIPKDINPLELPKFVADMHRVKYPIQELPAETVRSFMNEVGSMVSGFEKLFVDGHFKI